MNLNLTYLKDKNDIILPITYNKNYTSFNEDILYTNMICKIEHIFIPHPFLAFSKCKYKKPLEDLEIKPTTNPIIKLELIYTLLPYDNVVKFIIS